MFEIGILEEFAAAHYLEGGFGPACRLHGHTYKVEVLVQGDKLDDEGKFYDIGKLKRNLQETLNKLHCRYLNELTGFKNVNPTAENVCKYIYEQLAPPFREEEIRRLKVRVWESSSAFASYWEDLSD